MSVSRARESIAGVYAVTLDVADTELLLNQVRSAVMGGIKLIQYRNKAASPNLRDEQSRALAELCAAHGVTFIVNDHVDVAIASNADGVHLGGEDGSVKAARDALGPHKLIGVSCYNRLELAHNAVSEGADHVAFGSFYPSQIKPGAVKATPELLVRARRELGVPIAAIGGITQKNGGALIDAGADALAVISSLFAAADIEAAARNLTHLFSRNE